MEGIKEITGKERLELIGFKKITEHKITITSSNNGGFIVNVGCCTMVYTSVRSLIYDLGTFLQNPKEVEKKYKEFYRESNSLQRVTSVREPETYEPNDCEHRGEQR